MKQQYEVRAIRSSNWWALDVPEVRGVHSQVRRLDQAEPMIREALAMGLEVAEDSFDVTIVPDLDDVLSKRTRLANERRDAAAHARDEATDATRKAVFACFERGLSARDAAMLLGVSFQYAAKLAKS
jgi:DNA-directed RNA polymerase specialized sigma24 family protein